VLNFFRSTFHESAPACPRKRKNRVITSPPRA
jgi:hypothetical protein